MSSKAELEGWIGAVLIPEVRPGRRPEDSYFERFPPAGIIALRSGEGGDPALAAEIEIVRDLIRRADRPEPFACSDLEEGAGAHFASGTRLPPAMALAAADASADRGAGPGAESRWLRRAGTLCAQEARALGVELVLAPVVDLNSCRSNPIVAVRGLGDHVDEVCRRGRELLDGLVAGGAGACPKHFPGHGAARVDSHLELPRLEQTAEELRARDLVPFEALSDADAVMVGHLDVPALAGRAGVPATLAPEVVGGTLRNELGFRGAVLTDAMDMGAVAREPDRYARALLAGCDGLLAFGDAPRAAEELLAAAAGGTLDRERLAAAARAVHRLREALRSRRARVSAEDPEPFSKGPEGATGFATRAAVAGLLLSPGGWPWRRGSDPFEVRALEGDPDAAGIARRLSAALPDAAIPSSPGSGSAPVLLIVSGAVRAHRGTAGLEPETRASLEGTLDGLAAASRPCAVLWFASPQVLPEGWWRDPERSLLIAFAPSEPMERAAAAFLSGAVEAGGSPPVAMG